MKPTFVEKVIFREISVLSLCCQKLTGKYLHLLLRNEICNILYHDDWFHEEFSFYNEYSPEFIATNTCDWNFGGDGVRFIPNGREFVEVSFWRGKINNIIDLRTGKVLPGIRHSIMFVYDWCNFLVRYENSYYYSDSIMTSENNERLMFEIIPPTSVKSIRKCPRADLIPMPERIILTEESKLWQELAKIKEKNNCEKFSEKFT